MQKNLRRKMSQNRLDSIDNDDTQIAAVHFAQNFIF